MNGNKTGQGRIYSRASKAFRNLIKTSILGSAPAAMLMASPAAAQDSVAPSAENAPVLLVSQCPSDLRRFGTRIFNSEAEAQDAAETLDPDCRTEIVRYNGVGLDSDIQYVQTSRPALVTGTTDPNESPDAGLGNVDMTIRSDGGYVAGVQRQHSLPTSLNVDISVDVIGPLYAGIRGGVTNGKVTYAGFVGANIASGLSAQVGYGSEAPAAAMADVNLLTGAQRTYDAASGEVNYTSRNLGIRVGGVYGPELREASGQAGARFGDVRIVAEGVIGKAESLAERDGYDSAYYGLRGGAYYNVGRTFGIDGLMVGPEARLAHAEITTPQTGLLPVIETTSLGMGFRYEDRDTGATYGISFLPRVRTTTTIGEDQTREDGWGVFVNLFSPIAFGGRRANAAAFDNMNYRVEYAQREEATAQIARRGQNACVYIEDLEHPEAVPQGCQTTAQKIASASTTQQPDLLNAGSHGSVTIKGSGKVDDAFNALCSTAEGWRYTESLYVSSQQSGTLTQDFQDLYTQCKGEAISMGFAEQGSQTGQIASSIGYRP